MFLFYNALLSVIFFLLRENVNALMVFFYAIRALF